jgi:hypothetical protein
VTPSHKPPSGEAVAQSNPLADAAGLEELFSLNPENVPPAVGNLLAVFREPVELFEQLGDEANSPQAIRAVVTGLVERQHAEREVFLSALSAYKDLTDRLAGELVEARSDLATQAEAAALEQARLLQEFLDRLDVLTAKISTSAARYESELAEKDLLIRDRERRVEVYAGQAADARSVIEDIEHSTSWRLTAPIRLISRILAQKAAPVRPDN